MINHGIGDWIRRRAAKSPDNIALVHGDATLTYTQLEERINRLADSLSRQGVHQGDRVAFLGENHPAFMETLFACGAVGAVFVPLNTRLAAPELEFQLVDSRSRTFVATEGLADLAVDAARDSDVERIFIVGDDPSVDAQGLESSVSGYEQLICDGGNVRQTTKVSLEDAAIILYTSGTTGNPKGAIITHGNITWNAINVIIEFDYGASDVALMVSPIFHVASLGMGVMPTLLKGGAVVLEEKFEPGSALKLVEKWKATTLSGVPTTFQMLADHPDWHNTDLSSLRNLTVGGSAVPDRILSAFEQRGLRFTMGYGMTESGPAATSLPAQFSLDKKGSSGLPVFHTQVRIVDPVGNPVPAGTAGEIQLQGPNVISAYWNRPEANRSSFQQTNDGTWFSTGDMGYFDEDGFIYISDRIKDMIISGGENVYPAQVEREIALLDSVSSVAVFGVPDDRWGEVPWAVVTVRHGHQVEPDEIIEHLRTRLAKYKIPKRIIFSDHLPRTASGKIRKNQLRDRYSHAEESKTPA
ncbi:long-chain fatty acid--CoA ligase [Corynebacterium frankenforstense]|uniref:acyl-CoA synthetase n=1 Tax=Corynebacterium frankenforstense TaxID=1230998 RepID=UPI0025512F74|nr:long-chain fatty acid--CoA ligase [Corynebacterium frankenforstense]MDK6259380.1 long-chain fatty acid--CoA ligase [Corynebacterium frankenforstense]